MLLALERRRYVWAAFVSAIPLSGQIHLAMGAVVLALGYAWAPVPADWWKAGLGAAVAAVDRDRVQRLVVAGSIARRGALVRQVRRFSAELSDFLTRGVGRRRRGARVCRLADAPAGAGRSVGVRRQRGLAFSRPVGAVSVRCSPWVPTCRCTSPLWRALPPLRFARVPERLLPIACLAVAALVALAVDFVAQSHKSPSITAVVTAVALVVLAVDLHVAVFGAVSPIAPALRTRLLPATGACSSCRCSGPTSTSAPSTSATPADPPRAPTGLFDHGAGVGRPPRTEPARGLVRSRLDPRLAGRSLRRRSPRPLLARAASSLRPAPMPPEAALRRTGWRLLARDGAISTWQAP